LGPTPEVEKEAKKRVISGGRRGEKRGLSEKHGKGYNDGGKGGNPRTEKKGTGYITPKEEQVNPEGPAITKVLLAEENRGSQGEKQFGEGGCEMTGKLSRQANGYMGLQGLERGGWDKRQETGEPAVWLHPENGKTMQGHDKKDT